MEKKSSSADAIALLEELRGLLELNGENPFKVQAFRRASRLLQDHEDLEDRARAGTLTELEGVGKGIAEVLEEFFIHGTCKYRDELARKLPAGLLELVSVPGLGPKKARALIEGLGVQSLAELEYACRENRLVQLKGFGARAQEKILAEIGRFTANQGQARLVDALPWVEEILKNLRSALGPAVSLSEVGPLRRKVEVLSGLEFLVGAETKALTNVQSQASEALARIAKKLKIGLQLRVSAVDQRWFHYELCRQTGSDEHWKALGSPERVSVPSENVLYERLGLPFIPPECRETGEEVSCARRGELAELLEEPMLKGVFHVHTTRSDGASSLEKVVSEAERLGYRYVGISDHSQSAVYANGLKAKDLDAQEREIQEVRERHPGIRIFWGIESDILQDGNLDYDQRTLKRFDFVIASVHSRFKMGREQMTARILRAVMNPCTRILGHLTGRLLLGRPGYEIDMDAILGACSRYGVAVEINAHPARLDIDWRWGQLLRKHGTSVAINPDAHAVSAIADTAFGVTVARKALLTSGQVINARGPDEVQLWLQKS